MVKGQFDRRGQPFLPVELAGYVQAQHIDTEFYDIHFQPGAYLKTHAHHMARWYAGA